ncbi:MAG: amidohydrolase family protein [Paracoccaceae bacterium]
MTDPVLIAGGLVLVGEPPEARPADILADAGRIVAVEPAGTIDPSSARPLDASDRLVVPGLVNGHTHGHGALAKGQVADRSPLEVFLTAAGGFGGSRTLDDKRLTAELTAVELVRRGCTTALDMFGEVPVPSVEGMSAVAEAYETVGMRAVIAPMMADRTLFQAIPGLLDSLPEPYREKARAMATAPTEDTLAGLEAVLKGWSFDRERLRPGVAPTIPLHCSDAFMQGCARLAEDHGTILQTHLAETKTQNLKGRERYGHSLTAHLEGLGLLTERFSAAHGIWLDGEDMARLGAHGCGVVHNPMSNLRLGSGVAQARRLKEAGVRLGVGTDASNTSDGQNMVEATRLAAYLSRLCDPDPARWLDAAEAFEAATVGSASILGFERVGRLAPGWAADMVFLDLAHVTYTPLRAPLLQMVFGESGAAIRSVMIAGRMVLEEGRMLTVDEARLRARAGEAAARLEAANAEAIRGAEAMADLVGCFCLGQARRPCGLARTVWEGGEIDPG